MDSEKEEGSMTGGLEDIVKEKIGLNRKKAQVILKNAKYIKKQCRLLLAQRAMHTIEDRLEKRQIEMKCLLEMAETLNHPTEDEIAVLTEETDRIEDAIREILRLIAIAEGNM